MKDEYYISIIGPTKRSNLSAGCDSTMRNHLQEGFVKTTNHEDEECWSGWGSNKERVDILNAVWSMDENDPVYKVISNMLKLNNRITETEL